MPLTFPTERSAQKVLTAFGGIPKQRSLNLKFQTKAPLCDLKFAQNILAKNEDDICEMIAMGDIAWAWNIGTGNHRREIRIFTKCVLGCDATNGKCGLAGEAEEKIIAQILAREPHSFIKGKRLRLLFLCHDTVLTGLLNTGELAVLPGTTWRRGRDGTPLVTKESVVKFLHARREKGYAA